MISVEREVIHQYSFLNDLWGNNSWMTGTLKLSMIWNDLQWKNVIHRIFRIFISTWIQRLRILKALWKNAIFSSLIINKVLLWGSSSIYKKKIYLYWQSINDLRKQAFCLKVANLSKYEGTECKSPSKNQRFKFFSDAVSWKSIFDDRLHVMLEVKQFYKSTADLQRK